MQEGCWKEWVRWPAGPGAAQPRADLCALAGLTAANAVRQPILPGVRSGVGGFPVRVTAQTSTKRPPSDAGTRLFPPGRSADRRSECPAPLLVLASGAGAVAVRCVSGASHAASGGDDR